MPGGDSQGEPRRINASSRGSGYGEGICQCRPHSKRKMGSHLALRIMTGTPSVRRWIRASKEKTGKKCTMSWAVGVKKPQEAQKARALWEMNVANDAGVEYDPTREDNILGRNKTRIWEEDLKNPIVALDKALKCVEDQY